MRLAIDASRITAARRTGTERYALELLRHLLPISAADALHLFYRDAPAPGLLPAADHVRTHVLPWPRAWTHLRLAAALVGLRPDVTFVPAHTLPFAFPGRAVVTLHDLGYVHIPEAHPPAQRRYLDLTTRYSARRATHVIADSIATRDDLVAHYGIPDDKISVVYPGIDPTLRPVVDEARLAEVRQRLNLPSRYLLFVGTHQPRKNIARLVRAYDLSGAYGEGVHLLLAGGRGWLYDPAWTAGVAGVRELGFVSDDDLAVLYTEALAFVFPSLYEGFGFPVLEAMLYQTPVIASATSSLPELAGEAALLVDPLDVEAIADALVRVVNDRRLRAGLIMRGLQQVRAFRWSRTAEQTLAILRAAASA